MQKALGVVEMERPLSPAQLRTGYVLSCYLVKTGKSPFRCLFTHSLGKETSQFEMSLHGAAWFLNMRSTRQMGSDGWYVPKICNENDCSVLQDESCDPET